MWPWRKHCVTYVHSHVCLVFDGNTKHKRNTPNLRWHGFWVLSFHDRKCSTIELSCRCPNRLHTFSLYRVSCVVLWLPCIHASPNRLTVPYEFGYTQVNTQAQHKPDLCLQIRRSEQKRNLVLAYNKQSTTELTATKQATANKEHT